VDNDGFITRDEMYNIVDAIYQMVVSTRRKLRGMVGWCERALIVFRSHAAYHLMLLLLLLQFKCAVNIEKIAGCWLPIMWD
jgi:hypothetical protein